MPIQVKPITAEEAAEGLRTIFNDLQTRYPDDWDWSNAAFCLGVLMTAIRTGPTPEAAGRSDDEVARWTEYGLNMGLAARSREVIETARAAWMARAALSVPAPPSGEQASTPEAAGRWISIEERLPLDPFNVMVWIPNQTPRGGYWDLASYGDYLCEDEDCSPGDPDYVEDEDEGNRRGHGWHREEETHGGPYDYVYINLNGKVTHWRPLPAPPRGEHASAAPPGV